MSKPSTGARPLRKGSLREPGGGPQDPGPGEELSAVTLSSSHGDEPSCRPPPRAERACVQGHLSAEPRDTLPLQAAAAGKFSHSHRAGGPVPPAAGGSF